MSSLLRRFLFLYLDAVRRRVGVLTYARNLPGNLAAGLASGDLETVARDLLRDVKVRSRRSNRSQLIAEIAVQCLEIIRQVTAASPVESSTTIPL